MIYSHFGTVNSIRRGEKLPNIDAGDKFPNFELPDQQVSPWNLSGQLELGAAMLVFYRGDW
jgi:peroxiredoxin